MSSTNLPNTKEKIFSWIFSKDYLQISEGACDWNPFIIFLQIFYCWFSFDFPLDFKIQSENHEKIYSKILWVIKKIISLVPRSEILRKSEFKIWVKIRIIQIHRIHVNLYFFKYCFRHLEKPIKTKENKVKHFFVYCFYMFLLVFPCFFRWRKQLEGLF